MDFVEICSVCTRKVIIKAARGYLILIRFVAVIVISILASLFGTPCICIPYSLSLLEERRREGLTASQACSSVQMNITADNGNFLCYFPAQCHCSDIVYHMLLLLLKIRPTT